MLHLKVGKLTYLLQFWNCCHMQKGNWKLFLHTSKSSWWMTCSVLSPAIWNHRIMSTTISQKHILILIFYYSVGRLVSPKFSLALSAANDGALTNFKSHYSSILFIFPSILFFSSILVLQNNYIQFYLAKKAIIRNVLPFPWFEAPVVSNKNTCFQSNLCFLNWKKSDFWQYLQLLSYQDVPLYLQVRSGKQYYTLSQPKFLHN